MVVFMQILSRRGVTWKFKTRVQKHWLRSVFYSISCSHFCKGWSIKRFFIREELHIHTKTTLDGHFGKEKVRKRPLICENLLVKRSFKLHFGEHILKFCLRLTLGCRVQIFCEEWRSFQVSNGNSSRNTMLGFSCCPDSIKTISWAYLTSIVKDTKPFGWYYGNTIFH